MNEFDQVASVAPATVTAISEGKVTSIRRKRKSPVRKNSAVYRKTMDIRVWKKAMQLAKGDTSRLEVRGPAEIVVHNPGWKGTNVRSR